MIDELIVCVTSLRRLAWRLEEMGGGFRAESVYELKIAADSISRVIERLRGWEEQDEGVED